MPRQTKLGRKPNRKRAERANNDQRAVRLTVDGTQRYIWPGGTPVRRNRAERHAK